MFSCASELSLWSGTGTATPFFTFWKIWSWNNIMIHFLHLCKLLSGMAESASGVMWVETHHCCYWTWKCIFMGKRSKWTTWERRNQRPVYKLNQYSYIILSIILNLQTFIVLVLSWIRNVPTIIQAFSVDGSSGQYIETLKSCPSSGALL